VVGVVQVGRSCQSKNPVFGVTMLPGGEVVPLVEEGQACGTGCRLDTRRLAGVAKRLASVIADGSDLVVINRFSRTEAEGRGLTDLITRALDVDIPVLVAVPEYRFPAWIKFSDGMNVRLACRPEALDRWWPPDPHRATCRTTPAPFAKLRDEISIAGSLRRLLMRLR
jgi:hypothetical protein